MKNIFVILCVPLRLIVFVFFLCAFAPLLLRAGNSTGLVFDSVTRSIATTGTVWQAETTFGQGYALSTNVGWPPALPAYVSTFTNWVEGNSNGTVWKVATNMGSGTYTAVLPNNAAYVAGIPSSIWLSRTFIDASFSTNAYWSPVLGYQYTTNDDLLFQAIAADTTALVGTNAFKSFPQGWYLLLGKFIYNFETPWAPFCSSNYPCTYTVIGQFGNASILHYDGVRNPALPPIMFSEAATNYPVIAARTSLTSIDFENVGFFSVDITNGVPLFFVGQANSTILNQCYGGEDSGLTNAASYYSAIGLGMTPGSNLVTFSCLNDGDNGTKITGGLWQGGAVGFHIIDDHADIEPYYMSSFWKHAIWTQVRANEIISSSFVVDYGTDSVYYSASPFTYTQGHRTWLKNCYQDIQTGFLLNVNTNGLASSFFNMGTPPSFEILNCVIGGNTVLSQVTINAPGINWEAQDGATLRGSNGIVVPSISADGGLFTTDGKGDVTATTITANSYTVPITYNTSGFYFTNFPGNSLPPYALTNGLWSWAGTNATYGCLVATNSNGGTNWVCLWVTDPYSGFPDYSYFPSNEFINVNTTQTYEGWYFTSQGTVLQSVWSDEDGFFTGVLLGQYLTYQPQTVMASNVLSAYQFQASQFKVIYPGTNELGLADTNGKGEIVYLYASTNSGVPTLYLHGSGSQRILGSRDFLRILWLQCLCSVVILGSGIAHVIWYVRRR